MSSSTLLERNRLILCHFDSYSTALRFVIINGSAMLPLPLPEDAQAVDRPQASGDAPADVLRATLDALLVQPDQIEVQQDFAASVGSGTQPVQIHLARFMTFEAPQQRVAPHDGSFKPISELRRLPMTELLLLRQAFNLIMGA